MASSKREDVKLGKLKAPFAIKSPKFSAMESPRGVEDCCGACTGRDTCSGAHWNPRRSNEKERNFIIMVLWKSKQIGFASLLSYPVIKGSKVVTRTIISVRFGEITKMLNMNTV